MINITVGQVQIRATPEQVPNLLRELASRIIDWRVETLTIRPEVETELKIIACADFIA